MNEVSISHSVAWSLIPWLVNGTISADDRHRLERHLDDCEECHAQYLLECRFYNCMQDDVDVNDDPRLALAQLFERIDAEQVADVAAAAARGSKPMRSWNRWLAAAVIVQAIGLASLGATYLKSSGNETLSASAEYRTLSRPARIGQTAVIRFVPAADMRIATMQSLLASSGVQIVESSPQSAIFGLALTPGAPDSRHRRIAQAVRLLSSRPDVLFAEPILVPAQASDD